MDKNIVAIIPARGGSKGIPHKNICMLAGKPLIAYTVESALRAESLSRVIVSTDDVRIAEIAKSYGAEVPFLRPIELAQDDTPGFRVIQHAIKYLEDAENYKVDIAVILQPTSPLRDENYIEEAVKKLLETGSDSVVTVCKTKHHPFWTLVAKNGRILPFSKEGVAVSRRQDLPEVYGINGAVYAVDRNVLFEQDSVIGSNTKIVIMSSEESVDINDYFDLFIAEMILKNWKEWIHEKSKDWK